MLVNGRKVPEREGGHATTRTVVVMTWMVDLS